MFSVGYTIGKEQNSLYDYTGMLELFLKREAAPKLEVVFIDEAQDLSPIQWEMVALLQKNSKICYVAGDDDQAIFRYAGADVEHFVNLPGQCHHAQQELPHSAFTPHPKQTSD
jgi:superfamily I DNA/RNA helicase